LQESRCPHAATTATTTTTSPTPNVPESAPKPPSSIRLRGAASAFCKPWGDSERYDFILDNRPHPEVHLFRIQIKCTDSLRGDAYETRATYSVGRRHVAYTKRDIDFIAAHVVALDIWYIIPVEVCTPQPMLRFYPHRQAKRPRLEKYREAWHLLDPPLTIHACIDPDYAEIGLEEAYPEATDPKVP
jgi:hypothetical protein